MARILIVEDSISDRELVKALLLQSGHAVVAEAGSGTEAILAFHQHRPDLVLMDLVLPELNGIDAAKAILGQSPEARIVAVSGLSHPSVQNEVFEAGMHAFVSKPIDTQEILQEISILTGHG